MVGGCDDKRDGYVNMQKIKKTPKWQEEFFAFAWCANLGEEWYLPATEELKSIYIAKPKINSTISAIINSTLSANGCNILDDYDYYWSSVEENVYCSCVVSMNDGCINANFAKDGISYVRAVSAF